MNKLILTNLLVLCNWAYNMSIFNLSCSSRILFHLETDDNKCKEMEISDDLRYGTETSAGRS